MIDYYELLNVQTNCTDDDLKKAYRKLALKWHPDKNHGNSEEATIRFSEIKEAYETLSDPQERSWYDSHKEQILRGDDIGSFGYGDSSDYQGTSSETILKYFSISVFKGFDDEAHGFYTIYRELFKTLRDEEIKAISVSPIQVSNEEIQMLYQLDFGDSGSLFDPYYQKTADSVLEDEKDSNKFKSKRSQKQDYTTLKSFYAFFTSFTTHKTFLHKEKYRLPDAPNRQIKRLMEKENKQLVEQAKREFVDSVQNLSNWVKKRDPRFKSYTELVAKTQAAKLATKKKSESKKKKQAAPEVEFKRQDWMQVDYTNLIDEHLPEFEGLGVPIIPPEDRNSSSNGNAVFSCLVCDKDFKSNLQLENHYKSKKHKRAAIELQAQMEHEDDFIGNMNTHKKSGSLSSHEEFVTPNTSPRPELASVDTKGHLEKNDADLLSDRDSELEEALKASILESNKTSGVSDKEFGLDSANLSNKFESLDFEDQEEQKYTSLLNNKKKKNKSKKSKVLKFSLNSDSEPENI
ncbi:DnaJ-like protein [Smittium culicis]|uniref:DnaJ-like protein n=1 Tax=Smittium culicis TaxID=133412 RepID=A0A1R1XAM5_9FUNG|nr:DnaJ-like protein [Smittium culicis]